MTKLLSSILKWAGNKLATFLVILSILVAGAWIKREWSVVSGKLDMLEQLEASASAHREDVKRLNDEIEKTSGPIIAEIADLDKQSEDAWRSERVAAAEYREWQSQVGWYQYTFEKWKVEELGKAYAAHTAAKMKARAIDSLKDEKKKAISDAKIRTLIEQKDAADSKARETESAVGELNDSLANDPTHRVIAQIREQIPAALVLLLGVILSPVLIKAFIYYVIAPLVKRLPPIRIIPADSGAPVPHIENSAVTHAIRLGPDEELLVHQDYLQVADVNARKKTQWFLNRRIPFTSIAAGMAILTRIRPDPGSNTEVVVSSLKDPLGEIGVLTIPDGAAMVLQPRSLVGVVKASGGGVTITRHWRILSAHAWVTLQLRYLAFHGPCRLIIKGCRGIRAEQSGESRPRQINQDATIGFSANLEYSNVRCETFISYLRGKEPLFNDMFGGGPGIYAYEEMPSAPGKDLPFGRGIEGTVDTLMKVFGI